MNMLSSEEHFLTDGVADGYYSIDSDNSNFIHSNKENPINDNNPFMVFECC